MYFMVFHTLMAAIETSHLALPVSAKAALHARKNIRYKIFPLTKCPYMLFYHCFVLNFTLIKLQYEPIAQSFPRRQGWLEYATGVCWRGSANRQPIMAFFLYVPWSWCNSVSSRPTGVSLVGEAGWNARRECVARFRQ